MMVKRFQERDPALKKEMQDLWGIRRALVSHGTGQELREVGEEG